MKSWEKRRKNGEICGLRVKRGNLEVKREKDEKLHVVFSISVRFGVKKSRRN